MNWLRMVIHALIGRDRYHDQANEVQTRKLRAEILHRRLQVIERRHNGR